MAALALGAAAGTAKARGWRDDGDGARCLSAYGETRCGFDCRAAYGEVRCAATLDGVCEAAYGKETCRDPPRRRGSRRGGEAARCVSVYGETRCGYGCTAAYGEVRCGDRAGATCLAAHGENASGFGCKAAYGEVRCAQRHGGVCEAARGEMVCIDRPADRCRAGRRGAARASARRAGSLRAPACTCAGSTGRTRPR